MKLRNGFTIPEMLAVVAIVTIIIAMLMPSLHRAKEAAIRDLQVIFEGQIQERDQATQSVKREYWFRSDDQSFRIRTVAGAAPDRPFSERGVQGGKPERYWEWAHKRRTPLKLTNRDHRKSISAIRRDRDEFVRIVKTVLLARLLDNKTTVTFAKQRSVRLELDAPASARHVF